MSGGIAIFILGEELLFMMGNDFSSDRSSASTCDVCEVCGLQLHHTLSSLAVFAMYREELLRSDTPPSLE